VLELVSREDMTNAIALNSTMFNIATVVGPSIAGITYAALGPAWCFSLNGISFIAIIIALLLMRLAPLQREIQPGNAFSQLKALSTRNDAPQKASRPFDRDRDGFILSEGAVALILESLEHAQKRGANILAEIVGYGATADSFHVTQPLESGEGAAKACRWP
jgi:MFS family permease